MKKILFTLGTVAILASCTNNNPRTAADTQALKPTIDTAGLAQFQQWKAQNELATTNQLAATNQAAAAVPVKEVVRERVVYVDRPTRRKTTTTHRSYSNGSGVYSSSSSNTAKRGWSKSAKGAVIGGVGGAVLGAVINKRNRAAGAAIGGILGAGGGYVIGRGKDKRDGRY